MCKELLKIREFLARDDFDGFTGDDLFIKKFIKQGWGQDIAALSNMAEGLRNIALTEPESKDEMAELIDQVIQRAIHRSVNPWNKPFDTITDFGHFGYYLEHLNIILGCYQLVGDDRYLDLSPALCPDPDPDPDPDLDPSPQRPLQPLHPDCSPRLAIPLSFVLLLSTPAGSFPSRPLLRRCPLPFSFSS